MSTKRARTNPKPNPKPVAIHFFPKARLAKEAATPKTIPELPAITAAAPAPSEPTAPPADLEVMSTLGHELFSRGRVNEARVIFEGLVIANPADAFAHTMLGTIALSLHDFTRALECFERALAIDPNELPALVYRGEIFLERKKLKPATSDLRKALEIGPPNDPFVQRAARLLELARKSTKTDR